MLGWRSVNAKLGSGERKENANVRAGGHETGALETFGLSPEAELLPHVPGRSSWGFMRFFTCIKGDGRTHTHTHTQTNLPTNWHSPNFAAGTMNSIATYITFGQIWTRKPQPRDILCDKVSYHVGWKPCLVVGQLMCGFVKQTVSLYRLRPW